MEIIRSCLDVLFRVLKDNGACLTLSSSMHFRPIFPLAISQYIFAVVVSHFHELPDWRLPRDDRWIDIGGMNSHAHPDPSKVDILIDDVRSNRILCSRCDHGPLVKQPAMLE